MLLSMMMLLITYFEEIKKELIRIISSGESDGEEFIDILMIAKYLERIGDHATNIAEWVEYSILGYTQSKSK